MIFNSALLVTSKVNIKNYRSINNFGDRSFKRKVNKHDRVHTNDTK